MKFKNIGVMSPGDMGQAVAQQMKQKGFNVWTALDKRSARLKTLAQQAGITDVGSIQKLTEQCEIMLSIMDPAAALDFASEVAQALIASQRTLLFVDCNGIGPGTMQAINAKITSAGGRCVDAGITGQPPRGIAKIVLHVSGVEARELEELATPQITVNVVSERVGDVSAWKMCYSGMAKGMTAMVTGLLTMGHRLGVGAVVEAQLRRRWGGYFDEIIAELPKMPYKAYRWAPEMLEVAKTLESVGLPPGIFEGAADMYKFIAATELGNENPENKKLSGKEIVLRLAQEHSYDRGLLTSSMNAGSTSLQSPTTP